jgi:hypothetical protein
MKKVHPSLLMAWFRSWTENQLWIVSATLVDRQIRALLKFRPGEYVLTCFGIDMRGANGMGGNR